MLFLMVPIIIIFIYYIYHLVIQANRQSGKFTQVEVLAQEVAYNISRL